MIKYCFILNKKHGDMFPIFISFHQRGIKINMDWKVFQQRNMALPISAYEIYMYCIL